MKTEFKVLFYVALNFVSSVGVVCTNKLVFNAGFRYGTLLTVFHFIFTFVSLFLAVQLRLLQHKPLRLSKVAPLCATYSGFVALTNVSLVFNPISLSQLMKVLNTPTVLLLEFLLYRKTHSRNVLMSLIVCIMGVTLTTATDVRTTVLGTVIALSATGVTALNQVFVGQKQKDLHCNALQLLLYQAPLSALMLMPTVPLIDYGIMNTFSAPSLHLWWLILLSCIAAVGVNASIFLVIGNTSALTYNIVSQAKLVTQVTIDFLFFGGRATFKVVTGICITIIGVFLYSHVKIKEMNKQQ